MTLIAHCLNDFVSAAYRAAADGCAPPPVCRAGTPPPPASVQAG